MDSQQNVDEITSQPIASGTISLTRLRLSSRENLAFSNFTTTESPVIACLIRMILLE